MAGNTSVPCPTCGKNVEWTQASSWRPFCSERCRLIDLGEWLDEGHRIPDKPAEDQGKPWDPDQAH